MSRWRWTTAVCAVVFAMGCGDDGVAVGPDGGGDDGSVPVGDGGGTLDGGPTDGGGSTCIDEDDDGYGEGCAAGPDCDDTDNAVSPAATESCNGADDDCDGTVDDGIEAPACALTLGVCAGATARCGATGFLTCDATDYGSEYEMTETLCDGLDNDCDGTTDEGCTCEEGATQACGSDVGACTPGTQTCTDGVWGACEGEVAAGAEACNGADDDCDGMTDEPGDLAASAPACALQLGVCAGSRRTCGGVAGWIACSGVESYGGEYQATETLCDGLDNDCDGVADEGCDCIDGTTQRCGSDVGACMAGTQTCTSGAWGACAGEVASVAETCNGVDDDCDGTPDDGLVGPACALTEGVCAGSRQTCGGAGGFVACDATSYGPSYQATETRCDGFDNDCDGETDEGCDCIDGTTQPCGSAVGTCTRGVQTCSAGAWGACTGGTGPVAEICNGLDDDCNGVADDALTAPACALAEGVCTGTVQTCGGAAGWIACTAADYGPSYVATEAGGTDEGICDGLDNDCDGTVDDGCTSGPILNATEDETNPDLYNQHLVYLVNFDGNWDVVFSSFATGETRRLTTTAANEGFPRIYGDHVVFERGEGAAARVVAYHLRTNTETVLSSAQSGGATISRNFVLWHELVGTDYEIFVHDLTDGTTANLFGGAAGTNEYSPSMRGGIIAFISDVSGVPLVHVLDLTEAEPTAVAQTPGATSMHGQSFPIADYGTVGWTDARAITAATATATDDWDIYGAPLFSSPPLVSFPGENFVTIASAPQHLNDIESGFFVWTDGASGNWDVAIGAPGGGMQALTTHPSTQGAPVMSGNVVVWMDNRRGGFDLYATALGGIESAPVAGGLVINEILADPAASADVNGDGTANTSQDEFVEIVNFTGGAVDLSGVTLSDASSVRHTFPAGTVVPALGSIVVFGGGTIGTTALFGGAIAQIASSGQLGLNNDADTLTLRLGTTVLATASYSGSLAGGDQSIVRATEVDDTSPFVRHSTVTGAVGAYSPGVSTSGFAF